jgi:heptose III glucuronosyltransferase
MDLINGDRRFRLLQHTENRGAYASRVSGFLVSLGDYIGFVDSDDRVEPHMFETLLTNAVEKNADITICSVLSEQPDGTMTERVRLPDRLHDQSLLAGFAAQDFGAGSLGNKLYCRRVLAENPTMNRDLRIRLDRAEDYVVNAGCFYLARRVVTLAEPLYYAFERLGSVSRSDTAGQRLAHQLESCAKGMKIYADWNRETTHELGLSFYRRLAFQNVRPRTIPDLLTSARSLLKSLASIAWIDPKVAFLIAKRIVGLAVDARW